MRPREVQIKVSRLDDGRYTGWVGITKRTGQWAQDIPLDSTTMDAALTEMHEQARRILQMEHEQDDQTAVRVVHSAGPPGMVAPPSRVATCRLCGSEYLLAAIGRERCPGERPQL